MSRIALAGALVALVAASVSLPAQAQVSLADSAA